MRRSLLRSWCVDQFTAKRELLLLTVFRRDDGWGLRVEETDDPEGAYAPKTTFSTERSAKSKAMRVVQELFGYGYTERDFQWEPSDE